MYVVVAKNLDTAGMTQCHDLLSIKCLGSFFKKKQYLMLCRSEQPIVSEARLAPAQDVVWQRLRTGECRVWAAWRYCSFV